MVWLISNANVYGTSAMDGHGFWGGGNPVARDRPKGMGTTSHVPSLPLSSGKHKYAMIGEDSNSPPHVSQLIHRVFRRCHGVMGSYARSQPLKSGCLWSRLGQSSIPQQVQCPAVQHTCPLTPYSLPVQGRTARTVRLGPHGSDDAAVFVLCSSKHPMPSVQSKVIHSARLHAQRLQLLCMGTHPMPSLLPKKVIFRCSRAEHVPLRQK